MTDGSRPDLTPELLEVVNVFNMLSHELIQKVPALQSDVLEIFRSPKTYDGYVYFYRMLIALYEIYQELSPQMNPKLAQAEKDLRAISKGRLPSGR